MSCRVYCLVPRPEELDAVIERLRDAGIRTRDIAIVPRGDWHGASGRPPPTPAPSTFSDSSCFGPGLWSLSLAPALWWQWALGGGSGGALAPLWSRCPVIPLELYQSRIAAGGQPGGQ